MDLTTVKLAALIGAGALSALSACGDRRIADTAPAGSTAAAGKARSGSEATVQPSERVDDGAITAKVKSVLIADGAIPASKIDVDTQGGTVTLSGTATAEQSERAARAAATVDGVRSVVNRIKAS